MNNYTEMKTKIESLAVFSAIKDDPVVLALHKLLDELSFAGNDDNFSALKATLEGGSFRYPQKRKKPENCTSVHRASENRNIVVTANEQ